MWLLFPTNTAESSFHRQCIIWVVIKPQLQGCMGTRQFSLMKYRSIVSSRSKTSWHSFRGSYVNIPHCHQRKVFTLSKGWDSWSEEREQQNGILILQTQLRNIFTTCYFKTMLITYFEPWCKVLKLTEVTNCLKNSQENQLPTMLWCFCCLNIWNCTS